MSLFLGEKGMSKKKKHIVREEVQFQQSGIFAVCFSQDCGLEWTKCTIANIRIVNTKFQSENRNKKSWSSSKNVQNFSFTFYASVLLFKVPLRMTTFFFFS